MKCRLRKMAIKPTLACTANCWGCALRREYHKSVMQNEKLSLDQWKEVIRDSVSLGLERLVISGGEPTLYPHLLELICEIKKYGIKVQINTNGSLIDRRYAEKLLQAGLDSVIISIYSHQQKVHDNFRNQKNLWNKATNAVRIFADLCKEYPGFQVNTQAILLRENYRSFGELLKFHHGLGSNKINVAYLEGDFEKKYLLNEKEIIEFKNHVVPKALNVCLNLHPIIKRIAEKRIKRIYGDEVGNTSDLSQGRYWRKGCCRIPKYFALILANGDVHPCNIVEYTHEPIIGNILEKSFKEIWLSETARAFRQNLHDKCHLCPMNIHTAIPLRPESLKQLYEDLIFFAPSPIHRYMYIMYRKIHEFF